MRRTVGLRPSLGFVFLVASHLLLISMLAWGYTKPELDRVWLALQRMQRYNFNGLSVPDAQTIRTSLEHYPELKRVLIGNAHLGFVEPTQDGWVRLPLAHLITDGSLSGTVPMNVECRAPRSAYPVTVSFDNERDHQSLQFLESGQQRLALQLGSRSRSTWVRVSVTPEHAGSPQPPAPEVRVTNLGESAQTVAP